MEKPRKKRLISQYGQFPDGWTGNGWNLKKSVLKSENWQASRRSPREQSGLGALFPYFLLNLNKKSFAFRVLSALRALCYD